MVEEQKFQEILTRAYQRMHAHTCAEATLVALTELYDLPAMAPWVAAGYMGAIQTGEAMCGLVFGTTVALGLLNQAGEGIPEDNSRARRKAIRVVNKFLKAFTKEFGSCRCQDITGVDFADPAGMQRYLDERLWKNTCDPALKFTLEWVRDLLNKGEKK